MRNRIYVILLLSIVLALGACGENNAATANKTETVDGNYYEKKTGEDIITFDNQRDRVSFVTAVVSSLNSEEQVHDPIVQGNESVYQRRAFTDCEILENIDEVPNILANVAKGTELDIIDTDPVGGYYKIVYGGRVAFVKENVLVASNSTSNNTATNVNRNNNDSSTVQQANTGTNSNTQEQTIGTENAGQTHTENTTPGNTTPSTPSSSNTQPSYTPPSNTPTDNQPEEDDNPPQDSTPGEDNETPPGDNDDSPNGSDIDNGNNQEGPTDGDSEGQEPEQPPVEPEPEPTPEEPEGDE